MCSDCFSSIVHHMLPDFAAYDSHPGRGNAARILELHCPNVPCRLARAVAQCLCTLHHSG